MSLFNWLSPSKKKPAKPVPDSSGLSRMESTKPYSPAQHAAAAQANGQPANRKNERMARRELLYAVVREAMVRSGVLSSGYKFKVLSLDARGRQFLVMVDLAAGYGRETASLAEIEALIAQSAKARHDILVTSVYWRMAEHVAVGQPGIAAPQAKAPVSRPAPLEAEVSQPAPLFAAPAVSAPAPLAPQAAPAKPRSHFEPIQADEVEAFKKALAAGVSASEAMGTGPAAVARDFDGSAKHGPQSYTLLTGFEDTEMADEDRPMPALSATQYGDLR
jgi:hypothetical protein